jgi:hypothetical protein
MSLAWGIDSDVQAQGCDAFCHEDPPCSGVFHHQTGAEGHSVDSWMRLGKHGFAWSVGKDAHLTSDDQFGLPEGR